MHYHFVHECIISGEVELKHVRTDQQIVNIFTKPLGVDKLHHFSEMLAIQHLNVPHLRVRAEEDDKGRTEGSRSARGRPA